MNDKDQSDSIPFPTLQQSHRVNRSGVSARLPMYFSKICRPQRSLMRTKNESTTIKSKDRTKIQQYRFLVTSNPDGSDHGSPTFMWIKTPLRDDNQGVLKKNREKYIEFKPDSRVLLDSFCCGDEINDWFESSIQPEDGMKKITRSKNSEKPARSVRETEIIERTKNRIVERGEKFDRDAEFRDKLKFMNFFTALFFPSDLDDYFNQKQSSIKK